MTVVSAPARSRARAAALALLTALALAAGLLAPVVAQAQTEVVTLLPVADTWLDSSRPDTARGSATALDVDGSPVRIGLLRFDLGALAGREVADVRLRMHQVDSARLGGRVKGVSGTWSEATTWSTRPSLTGDVLAAFGPVARGAWYEVGLPVATTAGNALSLGLDSTEADGAQWASRESANPPRLVVTLTVPDTGDGEETVRLPAAADTYLDSSSTKSRGSATVLGVDASPVKQALLRFDLSGLSGRTVTAVRLRLHQVDASASGGRVQGVVGSWDETTTWSTRPSLDGAVLASFGRVAAGTWYEVALPVSVAAGASLSLGIDSTSSDGADWASRESTTPPELVVTSTPEGTPPPPPPPPPAEVDGLAQVADAVTGSSDPTYYAANHRTALTAGGRQLVVHGRHASGVQLAWRDRGGSWQTASTGASATGQVLEGTGTGDWPASIAVTRAADGVESAWVVWSGQNSGSARPVQLRRLTDLDAPGGPRLGPVVTVDGSSLGAYKADLAVERGADGAPRLCVLYSRRVTETAYELTTVWATDLSSDEPAFGARAVLETTSSSAHFGTLVTTGPGLRVVARAGSGGGSLTLFGHDAAAPLDSWWTGATGPAVPSGSSPSAVGLATGEVVAAVESDLTAHVTGVHLFAADGRSVAPLLSAAGLAQPGLAGDGSRVWLVAVRHADGAAVSRAWSAAGGWLEETVEVDPALTGRTHWPNLLRDTDGRLRLVVGGAGTSTSRASVWSFQRPV